MTPAHLLGQLKRCGYFVAVLPSGRPTFRRHPHARRAYLPDALAESLRDREAAVVAYLRDPDILLGCARCGGWVAANAALADVRACCPDRDCPFVTAPEDGHDG